VTVIRGWDMKSPGVVVSRPTLPLEASRSTASFYSIPHELQCTKTKTKQPPQRKEFFFSWNKDFLRSLLGRKRGQNKNLHSYWRLKKKKLAERKSIDAPKEYERKRKHTFREHAQRERRSSHSKP
jgi:hypothetical protein